MSYAEYLLLALSSLFVIIDPLGLVPMFLAMTPHDTVEQRIRMARIASWVAAGVLVGFGLFGKLIFKFLGVTLPAFQMAGCVVLLLIALDMLRAKRSAVHQTPEETQQAAEKDDVAITPLGVPILAGPGAISTVVLLQSRAIGWEQQIILYAAIGVVCYVNFLVLRWASHGASKLNPIIMKVATRLMGLLLAAIAFQFLIDAIQQIRKTSG